MIPVRTKAFLLALAALLGASSAAHALAVGSLSLKDQGGRRVLEIATRGKASPSVQSMPKKVLVVIPAGERSMRPLKIGGDPVQQIRFGKHGKDLHVVLDLSRDVEAKIGAVGASGFSVDLGAAVGGAPAKDEAPAKAAAADDEALNPAKAGYTYSVVDIALGGDEEHSELIVSANGPASYKPAVRDNGKLLSLTFRNSTLAFSGDLDRLKDDAIAGVSAHESSAGGESQVRVDVRLSSKLEYALKRDQNQVLLRLRKPERKVEAPRRGDLDTKVSLDVQNADLVGVIKTLAEQAGFEYQFTKSILSKTPPESLVTAKVDGRPLREVLDTLLAQFTPRYLRPCNLFYIGEATEIQTRRDSLPTITRTYSPKYLTYKQIADIIAIQYHFDANAKDRSSKGVVEDPRDKSRVMLIGSEGEVRDWLDIIARFDVPESGEAAAAADGGGSSLKTQVYRLQYLTDTNSSLIQAAILQLFPPEEDKPSIYQDLTTRTLVVTAKLKYLRKIEKLLNRIDVRPPQVNIEGKIVEMSQSVANQLGVNWNATQTQNSPKLTGNFDPGLLTDFSSSLLLTTVQNGFNIEARLQALVNESKADLVSAPNITVNDNQRAVITTKDTLVTLQTTETRDNGVVEVKTTSAGYDIPLTLEVTPRISTTDRKVQMAINFTLTVATGTSPAEGALPPTSTQNASTNVTVGSGETAVIGGLVRQNNLLVERKVPVLGDIPLLGMLFRFKSENKDKKEVIIFITPSIVED